MSSFGILMFIFGLCVFLAGLYMYTGHKFSLVLWRAPFKGMSISGWKQVGKWTMLASIFIFLISILGVIFRL